jgi:arylsulfatase A-like enzyme
MGHEFSLHNALLHVPLVVNGAPGFTGPATIERPASLADITASVLRWTETPLPPYLASHGLPESVAAAEALPPPSPFLSAYSDRFVLPKERWDGILPVMPKDEMRKHCKGEEKVFGGLATYTDYPYRLHWFENYPSELYDLSWDPGEQSNQSPIQPEVAQRLSAAIAPLIESSGIREQGSGDSVSEEQRRALKALGYID